MGKPEKSAQHMPVFIGRVRSSLPSPPLPSRHSHPTRTASAGTHVTSSLPDPGPCPETAGAGVPDIKTKRDDDRALVGGGTSSTQAIKGPRAPRSIVWSLRCLRKSYLALRRDSRMKCALGRVSIAAPNLALCRRQPMVGMWRVLPSSCTVLVFCWMNQPTL